MCPTSGVHSNQWQASPGMGGSFRMESVADFIWNTQEGLRIGAEGESSLRQAI